MLGFAAIRAMGGECGGAEGFRGVGVSRGCTCTAQCIQGLDMDSSLLRITAPWVPSPLRLGWAARLSLCSAAQPQAEWDQVSSSLFWATRAWSSLAPASPAGSQPPEPPSQLLQGFVPGVAGSPAQDLSPPAPPGLRQSREPRTGLVSLLIFLIGISAESAN